MGAALDSADGIDEADLQARGQQQGQPACTRTPGMLSLQMLSVPSALQV